MNNDLEQFSSPMKIQLTKAAAWISRVRQQNPFMKEAKTCDEIISQLLAAIDLQDGTTPQPAHTEQDGWIKCSERMPPSSEPVWAYAQPSFEYAVEAYWDGNWYRTLTDEPEYNITHWMPLPAAPKPESE
ncbi:DUF551 domain-containing protein [Rahnella sp. BCC 1045]|uniref:DUF551 domain-containing protein n=1 Tax=Rahnella sp. BCC 1045 TaxID=2816251 RepID=UPI001C256D17|nr:DUF551 domain-containing protein [Rahnella sp. BCC 1045]MBU9823160.1 DUF551 domain-containing protein [Rahnella sp. BCC 1045]